MQYGEEPCHREKAQRQLLTQPLNSAAVGDVCHQPRVSFDPPGCGSGLRVPALPEPCCHHGAQVGRLPCSLGGFPAVPPRRLSMLLYQFDRQVIFSPAFLPGRGWQTPQLFWTRKDTERGCAFCVQSFFSCLSKFSVIQFSQVIRLKETLCGTNGYSNPPCPHSAYRKTSVHNLVSPIGGKTISNKSSIIILRLSEERIYT